MKPHDMGVLFEECADQGLTTTVHLDRPFDLGDPRRTYGVVDLAMLVRDIAGWLAAANVRDGDRVAIVKDNHWDYDLLACAAVRLGAIPAQLSAHLPGEKLELLLKRLDPALLISTTGLLKRCDEEGVALASFARTLVLDGDVPGTLGLDDVRGHTPPGPRTRHDDEPLVINHTSGTTGVPKLVVHSTDTVINRLARFESMRYPVLGIRRDDTLVNASSYAHGRTFCWTGVMMCMAPREVVILSNHDPDLADPLLRAHPPTMVEALPATFVRWTPLTERLDNPFRHTRLFISTYDAMHPPTIRAFLEASHRQWPLWMQGWGQTETGPLTFRFHTRASANRERSNARDLGWPVPKKTQLRVVDPDTLEPVPRGRPGLLLVRTKALGLDYVGETERFTGKQVGGWWSTGDLGVRTRGGSVRLLDREVDRVPELSCLRTEDLLEDRLPEASECVLLGCRGEPPLPVVVTADGELDQESWQSATRELPKMQPPVVLTWDQVPRTGTGKVRRLALLEQLTGRTETPGSGRWT